MRQFVNKHSVLNQCIHVFSEQSRAVAVGAVCGLTDSGWRWIIEAATMQGRGRQVPEVHGVSGTLCAGPSRTYSHPSLQHKCHY